MKSYWNNSGKLQAEYNELRKYHNFRLTGELRKLTCCN